jgi:uracil-DNA glycosylase
MANGNNNNNNNNTIKSLSLSFSNVPEGRQNWNEGNIEMWQSFMLSQEGEKYLTQIFRYLERRIELGAIIRPSLSDVFNAYRFFVPCKTKVVIFGQDPYTMLEEDNLVPIADGLCFSVRSRKYCPRSLKTLLQCTDNEFDVCGGNLEKWAKQGVLLLNIALTTEDEHNAHKRIGWEEVHKRILLCLLEQNIPLVFMLFGNEARQFFNIAVGEKKEKEEEKS